MLSENQIGSNLREMRRARGLSLDEMANLTGLTKGYLSKVENSDKAPPVSTLIRIAEVLGVSIATIFGETPEDKSISLVRQDERKTISRDGTVFGYAYETLAHNYPRKHMEPYILKIPKDPEDPTIRFQHEGEEMLYVMQGKARFVHGDKEMFLNEGDCVYFDSGVAHRGLSVGEEELICLMVIYMPKGVEE